MWRRQLVNPLNIRSFFCHSRTLLVMSVRRERELDSLRTNLRATTDRAETAQRETKRLSASLTEAREEQARYFAF